MVKTEYHIRAGLHTGGSALLCVLTSRAGGRAKKAVWDDRDDKRAKS